MTITGFHHTGIVTRDLDGLAARYAGLGFTVSPRSRHLLSTAPGEPPVPSCTANQCVYFENAYIELLGIVDDTAPDPWHAREMGTGFRILNFATPDAAALSFDGIPTSGVLDLERDVEDGGTLRARAVHLDPRSTPEGYIGVAQHLTREHTRAVEHPNGARRLAAVRITAADFDTTVDRYARVLGVPPTPVFTVGDARLEIVPGPVSRLESMTVAGDGADLELT
ncbi:VOC family protein [Amycolatopsis sp. OK19-0408]|uniref:VOC family protein n=1 Tax=Amycolatopsis iheyensis TaxID=2945988 RepID=A0A9X2NCC4_9PSEU|nr:VOC family protein [Amycolatopsis iheyensis]MCR6484713.1 VOC family protein [Amycolatopsis iheyensis]